MSSPWRVFTWHPGWREADRSIDAPRLLDADALLVAQRRQPPAPGARPPRTTAEVRALRKGQHTERKHEPAVADFVAYADVSYFAARILLLSSEAVHHEALYCVGQTVEKYLKAVWLAKTGSPAPPSHDVSLLALQLVEIYPELPEFGDSELIKLCEHLQPFEEGVEPTNTAAERAIRPTVLWRKGSYGTQSDGGARFVEPLLTVTATCRQQGHSVLDYLTAVCTAAQVGHPSPSLLPAPAEPLPRERVRLKRAKKRHAHPIFATGKR